VEDTGRYLVEIMPVLFVPAAVQLMDSWALLRPIWLPVLVILAVTTVLVMAVTGRVAQTVILWEKQRKGGERHE
jgi:holin-like protein